MPRPLFSYSTRNIYIAPSCTRYLKMLPLGLVSMFTQHSPEYSVNRNKSHPNISKGFVGARSVYRVNESILNRGRRFVRIALLELKNVMIKYQNKNRIERLIPFYSIWGKYGATEMFHIVPAYDPTNFHYQKPWYMTDLHFLALSMGMVPACNQQRTRMSFNQIGSPERVIGILFKDLITN